MEEKQFLRCLIPRTNCALRAEELVIEPDAIPAFIGF